MKSDTYQELMRHVGRYGDYREHIGYLKGRCAATGTRMPDGFMIEALVVLHDAKDMEISGESLWKEWLITLDTKQEE